MDLCFLMLDFEECLWRCTLVGGFRGGDEEDVDFACEDVGVLANGGRSWSGGSSLPYVLHSSSICGVSIRMRLPVHVCMVSDLRFAIICMSFIVFRPRTHSCTVSFGLMTTSVVMGACLHPSSWSWSAICRSAHNCASTRLVVNADLHSNLMVWIGVKFFHRYLDACIEIWDISVPVSNNHVDNDAVGALGLTAIMTNIP